jgi:hypothetical protein
MTDEERQRTMDFILEQMAQFSASIQRHEEERQRREQEDAGRDISITQIRRILAGSIWETRRYRKDMNERMAALVDAQIRTEEALRSLAAFTERNSRDIESLAKVNKNGKPDGEDAGGNTPS